MPRPTDTVSQADTDMNNRAIASRLVAARRQILPLEHFPGATPPDLDTAYRIQDMGIKLWQQPVGGWKVGRIPLHLENDMGIDRLAGPIFANTIECTESGTQLQMPMFVGGFAAIEAEFVAVIDRDAPADKLVWSTADAMGMIADLAIGLEIASSPLAAINDLGPPVVVSDFGNNLGLIVGPSIRNWRSRSVDSMQCTAEIDGKLMGEGGAFTLTGGFVRSVQFLLELMAQRGRPLRAGDVIATGQTNGIHDIGVGQNGKVDFGDDGWLGVTMVPAEPSN